MRKTLFYFVAAVFAMAIGQGASAAIMSLDLGIIFEGPGDPTNTGPWVNITFDDGDSAGTVDLTISASGLNGNLEKISKLYLNLDPLLDPRGLVFSGPVKTGNFAAPVISLGTNKFKANGDGYYDILLEFDNNGWELAFNGGDVLEYTITFGSITSDSFDFISTSGGGAGQFRAAAHFLGLGEENESAWVTTPEPATFAFLCLGGLLLGRKKSKV